MTADVYTIGISPSIKLSTNMLRPRFCAELVMVVVVAASLVEPPSIWVLAAPLAVIVTPTVQRDDQMPAAKRPLYKVVLPAVAVAGVVACIVLAIWAIFTNNTQVGLFVAFAVFGTATLPEHFECVLPPQLADQLKLGTAALHTTAEEKKLM